MSRTLGAVVATMTLLATSLIVGSVGLSPASAADPLQGAPTVGSCYRVNAKQLKASSYTKAPVSCSRRHTTIVVAVVKLPKGAASHPFGHATGRGYYRTCIPAAEKLLGVGSLRRSLTAYSVAYFLPTHHQIARGASWMRCDLNLRKFGKPTPLPQHLHVGSYPFKPAVSLCLAPGTLAFSVCSAKHTYRATFVQKLKGRFPKDKAAQQKISRKCFHHVTSRHFRFSITDQDYWAHGYRFLTCYSQTRH